MGARPVYVNYEQLFSKFTSRLHPAALSSLSVYMVADGYVKMAAAFPSPDVFPIVEANFKLRDGSVIHVDRDLMSRHLQYGLSQGYPDLRDWVIDMLRKIHSPPTLNDSDHPGPLDLFITCGSLEAINLVFRVILDEGDWVLVEEATFSTSADMIHQLEANAQGIRVDADGIVTEDLERVLTSWNDLHPEAPKPKLLYVVPCGGNPSGITMSVERKRAVYEVARANNLIILEDDPYYFLNFTRPRIPSFLSMDVDGRVVRLDSFSKVVAPGFRTGVLSGPQPMLAKIKHIKDTSTSTTSGLSQVTLSQMFRHWGLEGFLRHADSVMEFCKHKRDLTLKYAEKHLTGLAEWNPPAGGMFLWLKVLGVSDSEVITNKLLQDHVVVVPGDSFRVVKDGKAYIRISFALATEEDCEKAFSSLAKAIRSLQKADE